MIDADSKTRLTGRTLVGGGARRTGLTHNRVRALVAVLPVLSVLGGCATTGAGAASGGVTGFYAGSLVVDGRPFGAAMNLRPEGPNRVRGVFSTSSPVSIEGDVEGAVVDDLLRITVEYRTPDGCDGVIEGILDVDRGGDALEGPVTVSDCDEPVPARLVLRRRETTR